MLVRERNIEVDELNETIASLQGKISTVEKINDQLRASNMCINLETANNIKPNHIDEKSVSFNYNSCRTKLAISKQSQTEHQDHNNRTFNDLQVTEFTLFRPAPFASYSDTIFSNKISRRVFTPLLNKSPPFYPHKITFQTGDQVPSEHYTNRNNHIFTHRLAKDSKFHIHKILNIS